MKKSPIRHMENGAVRDYLTGPGKARLFKSSTLKKDLPYILHELGRKDFLAVFKQKDEKGRCPSHISKCLAVLLDHVKDSVKHPLLRLLQLFDSKGKTSLHRSKCLAVVIAHAKKVKVKKGDVLCTEKGGWLGYVLKECVDKEGKTALHSTKCLPLIMEAMEPAVLLEYISLKDNIGRTPMSKSKNRALLSMLFTAEQLEKASS